MAGQRIHTDSGDNHLFDWGEHDETCNRVGIVKKCENGVVYTVEGNSGDAVRQRSYVMDSTLIMGYGV